MSTVYIIILFGPQIFIILIIDSLKSTCITHKSVNDATLSKILDRGVTMQYKVKQFIDEFLEWSRQHAMNINGRKTKDMINGLITNELMAGQLLQ